MRHAILLFFYRRHVNSSIQKWKLFWNKDVWSFFTEGIKQIPWYVYLVKNPSAFTENWGLFIYLRARSWSLFWFKWTSSISLRFTLISTLQLRVDFSSALFLSEFTTKTVYALLISHIFHNHCLIKRRVSFMKFYATEKLGYKLRFAVYAWGLDCNCFIKWLSKLFWSPDTYNSGFLTSSVTIVTVDLWNRM